MATWLVVIEICMFSWQNKKIRKYLFWLIPTALFLTLISFLLRDQIGVNDNEYLRAMIQHHSSAILTSSKILEKSTDPQVRELAEQIIVSQEDEILIMNNLLKD
jgi:rubrerythrin